MNRSYVIHVALGLCIGVGAGIGHAEIVSVQQQALYTTADDPALHVTSPGGAFDGVVKLTLSRSDGLISCTGALLNNGRDILTAAHCLTDKAGNLIATSSFSLFQTAYGASSLYANDFTVHPDWNGNFNTGNDVAIIHLGRLAPYGATGYELYRDADEVGQVMTRAGYGLSGTGDTGATLPSGTKRSGMNTYDVLADVFAGALDTVPLPGSQLVYDFDDGSIAHDAFEFFGSLLGTRNINNRGLGNDEVMAAPGDSGGPAFINNQIAGITSYGLRLANFLGNSSDVDSELNASFGEFAFDTRVSYFADWIDANLSIPPPLIEGDLDGDGFVGIDDLDLVLNRWNQTLALPLAIGGDPSGDGFVGIADLDIVLGHWNQGTPPTVDATVPEPATISLVGAGFLVLLRRRNQRPPYCFS